MAPHGESLLRSNHTTKNNNNKNNDQNVIKQPLISNDNLKRTVSDISMVLSKEVTMSTCGPGRDANLPPIIEVEGTKCECCGLSEDCTPQYIARVRSKFVGKWICGLCSEAVKEEEGKKGVIREEALSSHMNACSKFNKHVRAHPVLYQAEAMRQMLKKKRADKAIRANKTVQNKGVGIARTSSCIPAITGDIKNEHPRRDNN
ncbi:unnamed protein product [Cuscuta epithymum]|uniref:DUF1677 family protein n=1 Tax=Cuscuta epithymum TaxID=186058 RepID=A0AAV0EF24_9ASTE|nr:unnamed protein product [Cuscuta epithymum]